MEYLFYLQHVILRPQAEESPLSPLKRWYAGKKGFR